MTCDGGSARFTPGHVPHNKGKSRCPHGVGNMSRCAVCRVAKDAAYYQRIKRDKARMALLRERGRQYWLKPERSEKHHAAEVARREADRVQPTMQQIDSALIGFLHKRTR